MAERRLARVPQKVVHRHRIGGQVFRRVSELTFVGSQPKAILRWINSAGVRTPIYVDLDPAKLRRIPHRSGVALYEGTTSDPSDLEPEPLRGRRRRDGDPLPGGRRRTDPPLPQPPG